MTEEYIGNGKKFCEKCQKEVPIWNFEDPMGMATVYECLKCGYLWKVKQGE